MVVSVIIMMFIPVMPVIVMIIIPVPNTASSDQCCCKNCAPSQGCNNFFHDVPPVLVDVLMQE
jgi:hypothetical protein